VVEGCRCGLCLCDLGLTCCGLGFFGSGLFFRALGFEGFLRAEERGEVAFERGF
jgi:hypothetical protein